MSNSGSNIDFRIPGEQIKTLTKDDTFIPSEGSSFSTIIMSGIVSLLLSKNHDYDKLLTYINENKSLEYIDVKTLYDNYK